MKRAQILLKSMVIAISVVASVGPDTTPTSPDASAPIPSPTTASSPQAPMNSDPDEDDHTQELMDDPSQKKLKQEILSAISAIQQQLALLPKSERENQGYSIMRELKDIDASARTL